jgi:hypothetical protein
VRCENCEHFLHRTVLHPAGAKIFSHSSSHTYQAGVNRTHKGSRGGALAFEALTQVLHRHTNMGCQI